jgi:hypothetical protein
VVHGTMRRVATPWTVGLLSLMLSGSAMAQGPPEVSVEDVVRVEVEAESTESRERLDAIHDDLVNLRFEKALAGIEALLSRPGLSESERAEALVLRSQTHVAFGDEKAAEEDYREILKLRPTYAPDESLTPAKARARFDKVRARMIGRLLPRTVPGDARILVDGAEVRLDPEGGVPLLAGDHIVRAERVGFDPLDLAVTIEADRDNEFEIRLVPNARTVVLRTDPAGVEVAVDGVVVGRTEVPREKDAPGWVAPHAELEIENLPLGEHLFELRKPCFRTERLRDVLSVDLAESGPKRYDVVRLSAVHGMLVLRGGPPGAGVLVDGDPVGALPLEPLRVCPGGHDVVVSYGGRRIWSSEEEIAEAGERVVEVAPRPNLVIVGAEGRPPTAGEFLRYNRIANLRLPRRADFGDPRTWQRIDLPRDADIALGVSPATRAGAADELYLYSPILEIAMRVDSVSAFARPAWTRAAWGFFAVDSRVGGAARVATVVHGGPAAQAGLEVGDRIRAAGGIDVENSGALRRVLAVASPRAPLELRWERRDGSPRSAAVTARVSPHLVVGSPSPVEAIVRAAWAAVDGVALPPADGAPALANLALLLSAYGHHERAIETWRLVRWEGREGIGEATVRYHLGVELESVGREREAVAALRAAAAGRSTAFDDEGPAVAPAARDRLADLGVASDPDAPR